MCNLSDEESWDRTEKYNDEDVFQMKAKGIP